MKKIKYYPVLLLLFVTGCHHQEIPEDDTVGEVKTPVTVTGVEKSSISESFKLNAVSVYQKKNIVKANSNGYVENVFVSIGDVVDAGVPMFTIKTKEADVLSKINNQDSMFSFKGILTIAAPVTGIVTELSKHPNDYVADGDQLAIIADKSSFVFLLNIPFEMNRYASTGMNCKIILPDSTVINGTISTKLSSIDPVSQTQSYVVKPQTYAQLPENLIATVQLLKTTKENTQVIDKKAVLTDETIENFWVMKMINDSTAVKVPVITGIVSDDKIEILSPAFSKEDRIVLSGNYGLPDTAFVILNR